MISVYFVADKSEVKSISFSEALHARVMDGRLKLTDSEDNVVAEFAAGKWVMWELPNAHRGSIVRSKQA